MAEDEWSAAWKRVVGFTFYKSCAHCSNMLNGGDWYPVVTTAEDDDTSLYSFCDDECLAAWAADDEAATSD